MTNSQKPPKKSTAFYVGMCWEPKIKSYKSLLIKFQTDPWGCENFAILPVP